MATPASFLFATNFDHRQCSLGRDSFHVTERKSMNCTGIIMDKPQLMLSGSTCWFKHCYDQYYSVLKKTT